MAIEHWELEQRKKGNNHAADMARILREQYGDVPLPTVVEETLHGLQRFTPEARIALVERGYRIYDSTGQSIKTLRDAGRPFWSTWHQDYPELEAAQSRYSEVAIDPENLFLPDSNRKNLKDQEDMVREFLKNLKVDGVEAIVGEMPDYVELAFNHLDATDGRLFGEAYGYNYTRTITPTSEVDVARVGGFDADNGLHVGQWGRVDGNGALFVAPLIVPKAT